MDQSSIQNEKINIILVDDHNVFLKSFGALLPVICNVIVSGEARDGLELLELLKRSNVSSIDLILLDIEMPRMNGTETLKWLTALYPGIKVIMLSTHFSHSLAQDYIKSGARAFLPKNADLEDIIETIYSVHSKGYSINLSNKITKKLTDENIEYLSNEFKLSIRELMIIQYTCEGKTNKEICEILKVTERTIERYKAQINIKTNSNCLAV